jgi:hypothetical protein
MQYGNWKKEIVESGKLCTIQSAQSKYICLNIHTFFFFFDILFNFSIATEEGDRDRRLAVSNFFMDSPSETKSFSFFFSFLLKEKWISLSSSPLIDPFLRALNCGIHTAQPKPLASDPFMILSLLHEEMNMLH